jgi:hypothetical protein
MVLALNYELVSDATRALDAMRRVEEIIPDHEISPAQRSRGSILREWLSSLTLLPALPAWRVQGPASDPRRASVAEIDNLYEAFRRHHDLDPELPEAPV